MNSVDQATGRTPLHFAAEAANGPMIELLLRSGGLLDTPDASGLTPIHIASIVNRQDALNTIVKVVGSEVLNLPDVRGLTPLMHACIYGNEGNVKLLLKKKVGLQMPFCFLSSSLLTCSHSLFPSCRLTFCCETQKERAVCIGQWRASIPQLLTVFSCCAENRRNSLMLRYSHHSLAFSLIPSRVCRHKLSPRAPASSIDISWVSDHKLNPCMAGAPASSMDIS